MADGIICENSHLSIDEQLKSVITEDGNGAKSIRTMFVEACENDGVSCEEGQLPFEHFLAGSIGINECGKPALRLALPTSVYQALFP